MNLTFLSDEHALTQLKRLFKECESYQCAVAWATENELAKALLTNSKKAVRVVVGTHMYQTDPTILRKLMSVTGAKVMPPTGRLFHPKLYLFKLKNSFCAVIGSHNLTAGAFHGRNIEASVLVKGVSGDPIFNQFHDFIDTSWKAAEAIDEDKFLYAYERQFEANKKNRAALDVFHRIKKPLPNFTKPGVHDMDWDTFIAEVEKGLHNVA
jgi:HKD family nuclease